MPLDSVKAIGIETMRHLFIFFPLLAFLSACGQEAPKPEVVKKSIPIERPNYDFERTLSVCVAFNCKQGSTLQHSMSEYSANLIKDIGLHNSDTLASAREKITSFNNTRIFSTTIGETTDTALSMLAAHLSPGPDTHLAEYDIIVRTYGGDNAAKVKDWGARIRCAPVVSSTVWQTEPC